MLVDIPHFPSEQQPSIFYASALPPPTQQQQRWSIDGVPIKPPRAVNPAFKSERISRSIIPAPPPSDPTALPPPLPVTKSAQSQPEPQSRTSYETSRPTSRTSHESQFAPQLHSEDVIALPAHYAALDTLHFLIIEQDTSYYHRARNNDAHYQPAIPLPSARFSKAKDAPFMPLFPTSYNPKNKPSASSQPFISQYEYTSMLLQHALEKLVFTIRPLYLDPYEESLKRQKLLRNASFKHKYSPQYDVLMEDYYSFLVAFDLLPTTPNSRYEEIAQTQTHFQRQQIRRRTLDIIRSIVIKSPPPTSQSPKDLATWYKRAFTDIISQLLAHIRG